MSAEQPLKRSYSQVDRAIDPQSKPPQLPSSGRDHDDIERNSKVDTSSPEATEILEKITGTKTKGALSRSHNPAETETELCDFSKRPRLDEGRLLKWRYLPHETTSTSTAPSFHSDSLSILKNLLPSFLDVDPNRPQDPSAIIHTQQPTLPPPPKILTPSPPTNPSRQSNNPPLKPTPPSPPRRPTSLNQLSRDGHQALKLLFLTDHATKADAIHHALTTHIHIHPSSLQMTHLMSKFRANRSKLQNTFFAKGRILCAQLTATDEFVKLFVEKGGDRDRRLEYFGGKCNKARLACLYSHLGSAVDVERILAARGRDEKAFRNLMTQVFIHCMEDVWFFELQPCRRNIGAKMEKGNKEEMYRRFRGLTDRVDGLQAAKVAPGYLDVPVRAGFPRYVLFDHDLGPRDVDTIGGSDKRKR